MSGTATATFVSPTNDLRLVETPIRRKQIGETGEFINVPGFTFEFKEGSLTVNPDSARYRTEAGGDPDQFDRDLDFLREHNENGRLFHELGNEPERPVENSAAIQAHIIDLAFKGQYQEIAQILLAERSSYSRIEVMAACEAALRNGGAQVPAVPQTPEHELERVRLAGGQPNVEPMVGAGTSPQGNPAAVPDPSGGQAAYPVPTGEQPQG